MVLSLTVLCTSKGRYPYLRTHLNVDPTPNFKVDIHIEELAVVLRRLDVFRALHFVVGLLTFALRMDNFAKLDSKGLMQTPIVTGSGSLKHKTEENPNLVGAKVGLSGGRGREPAGGERVLGEATSSAPLTVINIVIDRWNVDLVVGTKRGWGWGSG